MADQDSKSGAMIGRDAETDTADRRRAAEGSAIAEQLNQTTSADAGGTVSGTGCDDLDIVFEQEGDDETRH